MNSYCDCIAFNTYNAAAVFAQFGMDDLIGQYLGHDMPNCLLGLHEYLA